MKTIHSKQNKFQTFLDTLVLLFQLLLGIAPEIEPAKPYVFTSPALARRIAVARAAARFELKKQGGTR